MQETSKQSTAPVAEGVISLPKGGGAIGGIGETFQPNLFSGTANFSVPIATSPGRGGFGPELAVQYSSGGGNGPFGLGWALSVPQVSRKTEQGLPRYTDEDTFLLSGAEDLVARTDQPPKDLGDFHVTTYRPRIEGIFARIEKWQRTNGSPTDGLNDVFWKITTKDNITSIYGRTANASLANPNASGQIYQWLLELTYDAKGNYIHYEYKQEDGVGIPREIYEQNRGHYQIYLKRIRYGNLTPLDSSDPRAVEKLLTTPLVDSDHFFTVVFDYGEHGSVDGVHETIPENIHQETKPWDVRPDPFSSFRAGFEIRTYRRCKRVLMFHNAIPGETDPVLVTSTDFHYTQNDDTLVSMLVGVTQRGYKKAQGESAPALDGDFQSEEIARGEPGVKSSAYEIKSIPRLDFGYTKFQPEQQRYKPFQAKGGDLPPRGLNDPNFALVDLFGTGLTDVLQTTPNGYYYWRNLGKGNFDRRQALKHMPAGVTLDGDGVGFGDMAGDGQADLLVHTGQVWGFYEATNEGGWKTFHPYTSFPSFRLNDPNVRMVDLTGDGKADALQTHEDHFTYFPCKGEEGFDQPKVARRVHDLDEFPDVYFDDPRVRLADMTGDGLKDMVMVYPNRIDYWPNLGYGHFGKRITMKHAPHFGYDFDPARLFLADIDGDGPADMLYVESGEVRFWFNQSGNGWSAEHRIHGTPGVTNADSVQLADMFGNGTTGILWSTGYPGWGRSNYLFLDLAGGVKPYVLTEINNNLGATTRAKYQPSTHFYLEDLKVHNPWVSTIPFPVQVLAKVEAIDHISESKLVTEYSYHHGYYDGREREFRGFGRVEQFDTEFFEDYNDPIGSLHRRDTTFKKTDADLHLPPVLTKSWFHTGVYVEEEEHLNVFRREYYRGDSEAFSACSTVEVGDAPFEAYRALRGSNLRTEVYALDGTPKQDHPYTVTENGFSVQHKQAKGNEPYAVFYTCGCQSLSYHYERVPDDPRISYAMTLEQDAFGNVTKSAAIGYPRRMPAFDEQGKTYITYTESDFINAGNTADFYLIGVPYETRAYEITGVSANDGAVFDISTMREVTQTASTIPYEAEPTPGILQKRLLKRAQNLFYKDDLSVPLPLGQIESLALPYEGYQLALTPGLIEQVSSARIPDPDALLGDEGKYIQRDGAWWVPSGRGVFDPERFYLPVQNVDPFGQITTIDYDPYALLATSVSDPLGNRVEAQNDYRTLQPEKITDPNGNRTAVRFDPLGMVVATAVMGKVGETNPEKMGDTLDDPTTRFEYSLFEWIDNGQPNFAHTFAREKHGSANPRWQESYAYSDGFGRAIMTKIQAEPGPAPERDPETGELVIVAGEIQMTPTDPRWVGTGRTIFDNKGNPVKQYEPFFSDTHAYEDEEALVNWGVTPILRYDPLGRLIRTDLPNGTFSKVEFDPWHQTTWDENDTVTESRWYEDRQALEANHPERRAANLAAAHADTPAIAHFDVLRRPFLTIADNGSTGQYQTHVKLDIEGNPLVITDAQGNPVQVNAFNLLGHNLYGKSMDAGERWTLGNVAGNPLRAWDSRGHEFRTRYDELQRPTELFVEEGDNPAALVERTVYGESHPDAETLNLKGQLYQQYDGAGVVTNEEFDFKSNPLRSTRQLLKNYKDRVDWSLSPDLETESFAISTTYDALNRPVTLTTPDASVIRPGYNEANLLEQVSVNLRGAAAATAFVTNIDYDAKGQRELIEYGNGARTQYQYDPQTFRLTQLTTGRTTDNALLQDLNYTYDPVGNITDIRDDAQQTVFFDNAVVSPSAQYAYDAIYRLIHADGREHAGQNANTQRDHTDLPRMNLPHSNDANALRRYTEEYDYDAVGNILAMIHQATNGNWTRRYAYTTASNRLLANSLPGDDPDGPYSATYEYDDHGNMIRMPHLSEIQWDFKDQMQQVDLGGGGTAYYVYDGAGERVRKVHAHNGSTVEERIYLGGYEIYRKRNGSGLTLERETLHIMDDQQRIALVETKTVDAGEPTLVPTSVIRYQLGNHLGSAALEVDEDGAVISYEEYHPYGTSAYRSGRSAAEVSLKRYRYVGKERDEETGLYYCSARYYTCWLGRWVSADPERTQFMEWCPFCYAFANPLSFKDPEGRQPEGPDKVLEDVYRWKTEIGRVRKELDRARKELKKTLEASKLNLKVALRNLDIKLGRDAIEVLREARRTIRTFEARGTELFELSGELLDDIEREFPRTLEKRWELSKTVEDKSRWLRENIPRLNRRRFSRLWDRIQSAAARELWPGNRSNPSQRGFITRQSLGVTALSLYNSYTIYQRLEEKTTLEDQAKEAGIIEGGLIGGALGAAYGFQAGGLIGAFIGGVLGTFIGESAVQAAIETIGLAINVPFRAAVEKADNYTEDVIRKGLNAIEDVQEKSIEAFTFDIEPKHYRKEKKQNSGLSWKFSF